MKRRNLFYLLLLPVLAFSISSCDKNKVSVTPDEVTFECDGGTKTVTVNLGDNTYYDAQVDEDGRGWCTVECPGDGVVNITVRNNTGEVRTCYVNCYVAPSEGLSEEEMTKLPVSVTQDAYKIEVTEPTFVKFNFETEAHRYHTDDGGGFDVYQMLYIWHRDWKEMTVECSQSGDRLTFWAHDDAEGTPNGDILYDHVWEVEILVTDFKEPYDRCVVSQVTYRHHKIGRNPDPNAYWQSSESDEVVTLTNIPLKSHNINVNGKTGHFYFEYKNEAMNVIEAYSHGRSDALNGGWYAEDFEYEGSDRDLGEVELKFNLK